MPERLLASVGQARPAICAYPRSMSRPGLAHTRHSNLRLPTASSLLPHKRSASLMRSLARILFVARVAAPLLADALAASHAGAQAWRWDWLGGAAVGFDADVVGHVIPRVK